MFLKKILDRDFDALTLEELKTIIHNNDVFVLKKKDLVILEKLIEKHLIEDNSDKINETLREALPSSFAILSNLDKYEIHEEAIDIVMFSLFSIFVIIILLSICNLSNSNRAQNIAVRII